MVTSSMVGASQGHRDLLEKLRKIAPTDAEVLLTGPTGSGKEMYAHFIHENSLRSGAEFVAINCAALSTDLLENQLFGHVSGAFTGARPQSDGLVAAAERGTLFLDEVDSLAPGSQVKLLRFIEEKEYRRMGELRVRKANVRLIAASNTDLLAAVHGGNFRQDLFFRLRVVPIEVPPLRERREDVPLILEEYVRRFANKYQLPALRFSRAALARLEDYDWPGNVRELENCVHYLTCLQLSRPIEPEDMPLIHPWSDNEETSPPRIGAQSLKETKRQLISDFEKQYITEALESSGGNISHAARASGKPRRAFFELMRKYGIRRVS
jgi:two-component system, NtrC family, response regulator GlrR